MEIKEARFIVSNSKVEKCPKPDRPEYAFIGRSNVGKSSLINMITNKKSLAKIVLLDLVMPETNGVELCAWIKSNFPEKKVIAFTAETNKALLLSVLKSGADAILIKSCGKQEIIDTIQNVLSGQRIFGTGVPDLRSETGLLPSGRKIKITPSEHRVLSKIAELGERAAAAKALGLTSNAINFHCTNIMGKFEEHNMMAVVNQARKANLIV